MTPLNHISIAIQGIAGSYHHQAAACFFKGKSLTLSPCETFRELAKKVGQGAVDFGVMAIENTIAGAILPNYNLISQFNLKIIGEIYLPIHHHLMALRGQTLQDIQEVQSHPMALLQCEQLFENHHHLKRVESEDTALSAKIIQEQQLKGIAAIAPKYSAQIYDLEVLDDKIQANEVNYTRFLVLTNEDYDLDFPKIKNKASIQFSLKHQMGILATVLQAMAHLNLNLTKIQSVSIPDRPWEYMFYVDLEYQNPLNFEQLYVEIAPYIHYFHVLGQYQNAKPK